MLTRQEADAIYDAGRETVVHVLLEMSRKIDHRMADVAALRAENLTLHAKCQALQEKVILVGPHFRRDLRPFS